MTRHSRYVGLSLKDDFIVTLYRILPIFGMNDLFDESLGATTTCLCGSRPRIRNNFIGPTACTRAHIDFVASQVGDRLGLFELGFA